MSTKLWKVIYTAIGIIGIASMVWEVEYYRLTFIDYKIIVAVLAVSSIPFFFLIKNHYSTIYGLKGNLFPILQSIGSFGFLITSTFILVNYHFPQEEIRTLEYEILKTGELGGRNHKPYAVVLHNGITKELVFERNPEVNKSDRIQLNVQTGLLGFEIISKQEIVH